MKRFIVFTIPAATFVLLGRALAQENGTASSTSAEPMATESTVPAGQAAGPAESPYAAAPEQEAQPTSQVETGTNDPAQEAATDEPLPQTATSLPWFALAGVVILTAALALRHRLRQQA